MAKALSPPSAPPPPSADFRALLERARHDARAVDEIAAVVGDSRPVWGMMGDLTQTTVEAWVARICGEDLFYRESVRRMLDLKRRELAGANPTPLEQVLVDQIVINWLETSYASSSYALRMGELDPEWSELYQTRQDRCQRRYLASMRLLAVIRKLQVPSITLNVAENQINVADRNAMHSDASPAPPQLSVPNADHLIPLAQERPRVAVEMARGANGQRPVRYVPELEGKK